MLENRRQQIADIDNKQHAMTLKSDPHQLPQTTTHAHGSRRRGWSSGVGKDTATARCQTRSLWHGIEARVICMWWMAMLNAFSAKCL